MNNKSLKLLLIIPALLIGACSKGQKSNSKESSIDSSEQSTSSESSNQSSVDDRGSSSLTNSSNQPSSSIESSSKSTPTSTVPVFEPYKATINVNLSASLNSSRLMPYQLQFAYDDSYFLKDARAYSKNLSLLSFAASLVSGGNAEAQAFYETAKFSNITAYGYDTNPTEDSIGYVFAHKQVDTSTVVAITVRGFNYGMEWADNFLIGQNGNHEGFNARANEINQSLNRYIAMFCRGKSPLKFWITGYSRGGGVANVLSSLIMQKGTYSAENIFTYTFEAPACLDADNCIRYENVHNVRNANDLVTCIPPESYGLGRCGIDYPIYDENVSEIVKTFDSGIEIPAFVPNADSGYTNDSELVAYILNSIFNQEESDNSANTREEYVTRYQEGLTYIVGLLFSLSMRTRNAMMQDLQDLGFGVLSVISSGQNLHDFIKPYLDNDRLMYRDDALLDSCDTLQKAIINLFMKVFLIYADETYKPSLTRLIDMHYPEVTYALLLNAHQNQL